MRKLFFLSFFLFGMQKENDSAHLQRFEAFMSIYSVDYSDAGCEFGWAMTDQP